MDNTVIPGLVLAAISGITFLAYKHPTAFSRLYLPIIFVIGAALLIVIAWNSAVATTFLSLKDFIDPLKHEAALKITHELEINPWVWRCLFALVIYLVFLLLLPGLLSDDRKNEDPNDK